MLLNRLLDEFEVFADPFAVCQLRGRCSLGLQGQSGATLHYVLAGEGEIAISGRPPISVTEGSLVLAPMLVAHTLRSLGGPGPPIPQCKPTELDLANHLIRSDNLVEEEGGLLAICSHITVGLRGLQGLIELVREPIVVQNSERSGLRGIVDRLLIELSEPRLGSRAIVRALLLECVLILIREKLEEEVSDLNWMRGLADQRLWLSMKAMLDAPGTHHSVESLAELAGMSRSSFAAHFSKAYGCGPMDILRDIRMNMAGKLLRETDLPVKRIAERVGFRSRSAFSRVFNQLKGMSPDGFRRSQ